MYLDCYVIFKKYSVENHNFILNEDHAFFTTNCSDGIFLENVYTYMEIKISNFWVLSGLSTNTKILWYFLTN